MADLGWCIAWGVGGDIKCKVFLRALSLEEGPTAALVISKRERKEGGKGSVGFWGGTLNVWICPIVTNGPRVGNLDLAQNVLPAFTLCGSCVDTRMRWPVSLPPVPGQVLPPAEGLGGEACWVDLLWNCSNSCKTTSLSLWKT